MNKDFDENKYLIIRVRHDESFDEVVARTTKEGKVEHVDPDTGLPFAPNDPWGMDGNKAPNLGLLRYSYDLECKMEKEYFKRNNYVPKMN